MVTSGKVAAIAVSVLLASVPGCGWPDSNSRSSSRTASAAPTTTSPHPRDGQQEYGSAQQLANELTKLGHRCDMTHDKRSYFDDSGRCYLGGSAGPEIVLVIYSSSINWDGSGPSQMDRYLTEMAEDHPTDDYAWLVGENWGINCNDDREPTLCSELQSELGGTIKRLGDELPPTTTTKTTTKLPPPMSAEDEEIANTAKRWLLEYFDQPRDGSFKNISCHPDVNPDMWSYCWTSDVNGITYSKGVLYLQMDLDSTQEPDVTKMEKAQHWVRNLLWMGPGPKIVMDNVLGIQALDVNGMFKTPYIEMLAPR